MSNGAMMSVPWWACSYSLPIIRGAPKRVAEAVRVAHREHEPVDHDLRPGREHGQVELGRHARPARLDEPHARVLELEAGVDQPLGHADEVGAHLLLGGEVLPHRVRRRPRGPSRGASARSRCRSGRRWRSGCVRSFDSPRTTAGAARASNCRRAASTRRTAARSLSASPVTDRSSRRARPRARSPGPSPACRSSRAPPRRPRPRAAAGGRCVRPARAYSPSAGSRGGTVSGTTGTSSSGSSSPPPGSVGIRAAWWWSSRRPAGRWCSVGGGGGRGGRRRRSPPSSWARAGRTGRDEARGQGQRRGRRGGDDGARRRWSA